MQPQLQFLGTGGAFDYEQGNSAALVTLQGKRILLDCGHSVYAQLRHHNLVDQLDAVLLTHLHDDHSGSLSTLLYHRQIVSPAGPLPVLVPNDSFREELIHFLRPMSQRPQDLFTFQSLASIPGIVAVDTTGHHFPGMPSYGFVFADPAYPEGDIAFSGDIGDSDLFLQTVLDRPVPPSVVYHDLAFYPGGPHTHYQVLRQFADRLRLVGYHHNHHHNPSDNPIPLAAWTATVLPQR